MKPDIGIGDQDRERIALRLSKLLADSYTLYLKTHNYQWNVTGPPVQHAAFDVRTAAHDEPTADLLTQRMQVHEKNAWMLRSMLAE